jgi:hypothetical protein
VGSKNVIIKYKIGKKGGGVRGEVEDKIWTKGIKL